DAGLIDPMTIPMLFAWFSADFGLTVQDGGGGVARWESHVPGQYADPLTPDLAPGFVANVQHDQPAVRFVASKTQLLKVNGKGLGGKEATLFVVGRGSTHAALNFRFDANSTPFILFPYDIHVGAGGGGITAGLLISGEELAQLPIRPKDWGIWEVRYAAGATSGIEAFLNGAPTDKVTPLLGSLPDNLDMYLGGVPPPTSGLPLFYDGDLGEVLVYRAALDDSTRRNVEAYLSLRWDIPLGN
ncbi:MAG TPA: hypothetical protein VF316_20170, partial [Polyangiaceae bacterium]